MAYSWALLGSAMGSFLVGLISAVSLCASALPYRQLVQESYEAALRQLPEQLARWRQYFSEGQEFAPPIEPAAVAGIAAALYEATAAPTYAWTAFRWLALYDTLRQLYPEALRRRLPSYAQGVPPVPDFFALPIFCRAYLRIRPALSPTQQAYLQQLITASTNSMLHFLEWGAINRSILRALGLALSAHACPSAPQAPQWRSLAQTLIAESRTSWLLEDAQLYWGIWLYALLLLGEYADSSLWQLPSLPFYIEAALQLMTPFSAVAPFGDTRTAGENAAEFAAIFEWAAARYRNPAYRWAAAQLTQRWLVPLKPLPAYRALILCDAARWADTTLPPLPPPAPSLWCSEDAVIKKLILRSGWDSSATYLLLNYRDAPTYGWRAQAFLHQSLPIEEEKGSHGQSDELALIWFIYQSCLLLSPPGYREGIPSGPNGAYRAEYFHNRLVVQPGRPSSGQSLWDFLRHAGSHQPVQTTKIDAWDFSPLTYARLRLTDFSRGYIWERILIAIRGHPIQLLIADLVQFLRDGPFTLVQLWHGDEALHADKAGCILATKSAAGLLGDTTWALGIWDVTGNKVRDTLFPSRRHGHPAIAYARWQTGWYRAGERTAIVSYLIPVPRHTLPHPPRATLNSMPTGLGLQLSYGDTLWNIVVQWDVLAGSIGDGRRPQYESTLRTLVLDSLSSDADFAFVRQTSDGLTAGLTYGTFLTFGSQTLFQAPPSFFPLQLNGDPPRTARLQWRAWELTSP